MIIPKIQCDICKRYISKNNLNRHKNAHYKDGKIVIKGKYKLNHDGLVCQFCGWVGKNRNSLCNHERLCKKNPNKQDCKISTECLQKAHEARTGKLAWNKGKTKDDCISIAEGAKKASISLKGKSHKLTEETKEKIRQYQLEHPKLGKNYKHLIEYNGIKLDSSYELTLVKSLDENNIKWERCNRFQYHDNLEKLHYYTPDFYLSDFDIYLDPKNDFLINNINPVLGYKDIDKIKWVMEENGIRVLVLNKNQLSWDVVEKLINNM